VPQAAGGYAVDSVSDGPSAVHQANEAVYDAIVLDVMTVTKHMSGGNGVQSSRDAEDVLFGRHNHQARPAPTRTRGGRNLTLVPTVRRTRVAVALTERANVTLAGTRGRTVRT
jgi:hypothetical protein